MTTENFPDESLGIIAHLDPDKHFIGESLPVPSASLDVTNAGSSTGASPIPARSDHTHTIASGVYDVSPRTGAHVDLNDDKAAYIEFSPGTVQWGIGVLSANASGGGTAIFAFRCGDGSAFCSLLASTGTVGTATGPLTGTTSTDGRLNISAGTGFPRIYVENRTAAARAYVMTFLSLTDGSATPGNWVLI